MKKSWLVEWNWDGGEWMTANRVDTPRPMRAGYPTKGDALRRAREIKAAVSDLISVRVVPVKDHPGVAAFPPYPAA